MAGTACQGNRPANAVAGYAIGYWLWLTSAAVACLAALALFWRPSK